MDEGADLVSDAIPNSVPYDIFSEQETEDITNEFLLDYRDTSYEASEECTVAGDTGLKEILEKRYWKRYQNCAMSAMLHLTSLLR